MWAYARMECLVNRVVEHDRLADEVRTWSEEIAANAPLAVAATKRTMRLGLESSFDANAHIPKFLGTTAVNMVTCIAKDRAFARAYDFRRFLQRELRPHLDQARYVPASVSAAPPYYGV